MLGPIRISIIEGGTYRIMVGASCADIRLEAEADVAGTTEEFPYYTNRMPSYYSGLIQQVDDKEFEELLGTPIPSESGPAIDSQ